MEVARSGDPAQLVPINGPEAATFISSGDLGAAKQVLATSSKPTRRSIRFRLKHRASNSCSGGQLFAQTDASKVPPIAVAPANPWEFNLSVSGYDAPHGQSYASPTFTADHDTLHLAARYNARACERVAMDHGGHAHDRWVFGIRGRNSARAGIHRTYKKL